MSKTTGILQDLEDIKARLMEISFYPSAVKIRSELQALCSNELSVRTCSLFDSIFSNKWRGAIAHLDSIIGKVPDSKILLVELTEQRSKLADFMSDIIDES